MLTVTGLGKSFATLTAVDDLSFTVKRGEIVGLLGPNGAGKSTTLRLLSGCLAADRGSVLVDGLDLATDPIARRRIGYAPEEPPLYDDMRAEDYLCYIARLKGLPRGTRKASAAQALALVDLTSNARRRLGVLSKGNRQRAALAQAVLGQPSVLLLDEPTDGLDPAQVANLRQVLRRLAQDYAIILSTHVMGEVDALCSRVILIHQGRKRADEDMATWRDRARLTRLRLRLRSGIDPAGFIAAAPAAWMATRDEDAIVMRDVQDQRSLMVALAEAHGGLRELMEERQSLEDAFRDAVTQPMPIASSASSS